jgi:hypothetical protein
VEECDLAPLPDVFGRYPLVRNGIRWLRVVAKAGDAHHREVSYGIRSLWVRRGPESCKKKVPLESGLGGRTEALEDAGAGHDLERKNLAVARDLEEDKAPVGATCGHGHEEGRRTPEHETREGLAPLSCTSLLARGQGIHNHLELELEGPNQAVDRGLHRFGFRLDRPDAHWHLRPCFACWGKRCVPVRMPVLGKKQG